MLAWSRVPSATARYLVQRGNQPIATLSASDTTYTDRAGVAGQSYAYCVSREDGGTTTSLGCEQGRRQLLSAAAVSASDGTFTDRVRVTWSDRSAINTGYKVYRAGTLVATLGESVAFDDTTKSALTPGAVYAYCVAPTQGAGEGVKVCDNGSRGSVLPPATVAATDGTVASATRITWTAPVGGDPAGTVYALTRGATVIPTTAGVLTALDVTGTPGTTYTYCVTRTVPGGAPSVAVCDAGGQGTLPAPTNVDRVGLDERQPRRCALVEWRRRVRWRARHPAGRLRAGLRRRRRPRRGRIVHAGPGRRHGRGVGEADGRIRRRGVHRHEGPHGDPVVAADEGRRTPRSGPQHRCGRRHARRRLGGHAHRLVRYARTWRVAARGDVGRRRLRALLHRRRPRGRDGACGHLRREHRTALHRRQPRRRGRVLPGRDGRGARVEHGPHAGADPRRDVHRGPGGRRRPGGALPLRRRRGHAGERFVRHPPRAARRDDRHGHVGLGGRGGAGRGAGAERRAPPRRRRRRRERAGPDRPPRLVHHRVLGAARRGGSHRPRHRTGGRREQPGTPHRLPRHRRVHARLLGQRPQHAAGLHRPRLAPLGRHLRPAHRTPHHRARRRRGGERCVGGAVCGDGRALDRPIGRERLVRRRPRRHPRLEPRAPGSQHRRGPLRPRRHRPRGPRGRRGASTRSTPPVPPR